MDETFVTVAVFNSGIEAEIARTRLEDEEIEAFIFDDTMVGMVPVLSTMLGGVKLKTSASNAERAVEILREVQEHPLTDDEGTDIRCPQCGSDNIDNGFVHARTLGAKASAVASYVVLGVPLSSDSVYRCRNCGFEFPNEAVL